MAGWAPRRFPGPDRHGWLTGREPVSARAVAAARALTSRTLPGSRWSKQRPGWSARGGLGGRLAPIPGGVSRDPGQAGCEGGPGAAAANVVIEDIPTMPDRGGGRKDSLRKGAASTAIPSRQRPATRTSLPRWPEPAPKSWASRSPAGRCASSTDTWRGTRSGQWPPDGQRI